MAEPLEYLAIGEAIVFAGESLGLVGTAAEINRVSSRSIKRRGFGGCRRGSLSGI